jgi:heptaprenyl diphosphate synthase
MFPIRQPGNTAASQGSGGSAHAGNPQTPEVRKSLALLGAFCLFLSTIEYMIPKPLPFMRIGIANLPLMLALDIFPFPAFLTLIAIKVLGQALITGTLFSYIFLFSLAGTFFSAVSMYGLRRALGRNRISFIGVGTAGAMISNITQLGLAWIFIFRNNVRYIAPPFLAAGLIAGAALGLFCESFSSRSQWYARRKAR